MSVSGEAISKDPAVKAAIDIAWDLHGRHLAYSRDSSKWQDCSGIFHRVMDAMSERCPHFVRPEKEQYRSSRDIAGWYDSRGKLTPVEDALSMDHLIQPGMVMFYGKPHRKYQRVTSSLVQKETFHVGIVVSVERDSRGRVIRYELFHGRSRGKNAAVTNNHHRKPPKRGYQPLGNGSEQWIGVSPICTDHECGCIMVSYQKGKEKADAFDMD